jgi:hypothetical protein
MAIGWKTKIALQQTTAYLGMQTWRPRRGLVKHQGHRNQFSKAAKITSLDDCSAESNAGKGNGKSMVMMCAPTQSVK